MVGGGGGGGGDVIVVSVASDKFCGDADADGDSDCFLPKHKEKLKQYMIQF